MILKRYQAVLVLLINCVQSCDVCNGPLCRGVLLPWSFLGLFGSLEVRLDLMGLDIWGHFSVLLRHSDVLKILDGNKQPLTVL